MGTHITDMSMKIGRISYLIIKSRLLTRTIILY